MFISDGRNSKADFTEMLKEMEVRKKEKWKLEREKV